MVDFVEDFVEQCMNNGITRPSAMAVEALKQRDEVDQKLEELKVLRPLRDNLTKVIKALNPEMKETKRRNHISVYPELEGTSISTQFKDIISEVLDGLKEFSGKVTSREIITAAGWENDDPTTVYLAIKWLQEKGILARNEDRTFIKGPTWEDRLKIIQDN